MKKKMLAGALFGLVTLGAQRAEANKKITLTVRSCDAQGLPWKQTDQDGRMGRLRMKDQAGQTVQTEINVHFSASRCQATFTSSFTDATLARFVDPQDPMFLTLEACKNSQTTCTYLPTAQMDDKPVVFQDAPIDSILPEIHQLLEDDLLAEIQDRIAAGDAETAARIAAVQAEAARATAAEQALTQALQAEVARATAAEAAGGNALAAEVSRAIAAELAEAAAREQAIADEAAARIAAIEAEATARAAADDAEVAARIAAIADEAAARTAADDAEAAARAAADDEARAYVDDTFVKRAGDTVDGDFTVKGVLRLEGGVSWDACPAGLDDAEHVFEAVQGTANRLCASDFHQTGPSVQVKEMLASYIEPVCPMVVQVVQNYTEIGGPAAIEGINKLLSTVETLLNDQITPFANGLIGATTEVTNDLIDQINGKIGEVNALVAAHTAGINNVIDAYNGLVTKVNTALSTSTSGLNGSITAINTYLSAVQSNINSVVAGMNNAVGDVNSAFAAIDASLGSTSDALNAFNNSPTGINDALGSLTTTLNARIGTINGLLDSISSAQTALANNMNSALDVADANIVGIKDWFNNLANNINIQVTQPLNAALDFVNGQAISAANYIASGTNNAINWLNTEIVGDQSFNNTTKGLNGLSVLVYNWTVHAVNLPWVPDVPSVGEVFSLVSAADIGINWQLAANTFPSVGNIAMPAALGHAGTLNAPTIGSLGLPTFNLGLNASMRTISHGLDAPALASVNAPQIVGANLGALQAAAIPAIPHVEIPSIPAWDGFQLKDAIDFDAVSDVIGTTMAPICDDIQGAAEDYLDAFLGDVPALVPAYSDAEEVCGSLGAHVCDASEIVLLAGDGTPLDLGYGMGDWTDDGRVMFNQAAIDGFMMDVDWPFLHPDASKLMTFPPGFPFTFTPPVMPTGRFRCCASSSSFQ